MRRKGISGFDVGFVYYRSPVAGLSRCAELIDAMHCVGLARILSI